MTAHVLMALAGGFICGAFIGLKVGVAGTIHQLRERGAFDEAKWARSRAKERP